MSFVRLAQLRPQPFLFAPTAIHPLASSLGQIDSCSSSPSPSPDLQEAMPRALVKSIQKPPSTATSSSSVHQRSSSTLASSTLLNRHIARSVHPGSMRSCSSPLVHPLGGLLAGGFGEVFSMPPCHVVFFVVLRVMRGGLRVWFLFGDFAVIWSLFEGHSVLGLLP